MSDPTTEQRAAKNMAFGFRVNVGVLCILCAANVYLLLSIVPKMMQIYADAIPGMPLPVVTEFIVRERSALVLFVLALLIPELAMFWRQKPYALLWVNIGSVWFFLQGVITVVALLMPMTGGIVVGMSDAPLKPGP